MDNIDVPQVGGSRVAGGGRFFMGLLTLSYVFIPLRLLDLSPPLLALTSGDQRDGSPDSGPEHGSMH